MIVVDVNVLVYACRRDANRHTEYQRWLTDALNGYMPVGIAPESLAAVVRITTHPGLWQSPLTLDEALTFGTAVATAPVTRWLQPGEKHWDIFSQICNESRVNGNLVNDAWLAALAIEQDCTLMTADRDFARFVGLRWKHPLA